MKPETQELITDIVSFSHNHGWELTLYVYRQELENEDLWSGFGKEIMKKIFCNVKDEGYRMRASDFLIKNNIQAEEMIDLMQENPDIISTESGKQMIAYLACILPKINTLSLITFFQLIFSIEDDTFEFISIKIADEVSKRDKPKPLS